MPAPRRYRMHLADEQWKLIEELVPSPKPGGRHEMHSRREIVNAILYHSRTGCSWRMLPRDLPPWETVYWYFAAWRDDGTLERIHEALRVECDVACDADPPLRLPFSDSEAGVPRSIVPTGALLGRRSRPRRRGSPSTDDLRRATGRDGGTSPGLTRAVLSTGQA